jgi:hypothetical protein
MMENSKSQAEALWDQADNLISEVFQALTDLSRSAK